VSLFVCSNSLTFSTLRHFWVETVQILCFFLVLRNFRVGTVKKSTLYMHNQVLFDIIAWFSMRPGTENSKVESAARAGITIVAPTSLSPRT